MQLIKRQNINFMGTRHIWAVVSVLFIAFGLFAIFGHGKLNWGIDFAGGTQLTLRFKEAVEVEEIRSLLDGNGIADAQIQRFGDAGTNEILIRVPLKEDTVAGATGENVAEAPAPAATAEEAKEKSRGQEVREILSNRWNPDARTYDINQDGVLSLTGFLTESDPEGLFANDEKIGRAYYEKVADGILAIRKEQGIIGSWDDIAEVENMSPEILDAFQEGTGLGAFAVIGEESVGPQIGSELRAKGINAVLFSLIGILAYIWFRFEFRFGLGALVALVHDVIITLGLFAWAGFEFNLSTIAAFLTLVGYSVNDSVVVFDRVRENMNIGGGKAFVDVLNQSINQTLSRTILTSGTTMLAVAALFLRGGDVLRGFGFVLMIGVVVGTYSSIFVASPVTLLWENLKNKKG